jgi:hypothetical protein
MYAGGAMLTSNKPSSQNKDQRTPRKMILPKPLRIVAAAAGWLQNFVIAGMLYSTNHINSLL